MKFEVAVVGAGIVGVATALSLQLRGRSVLLIDRQSLGQATSFGNAGIIQPDAIIPMTFPQDFKEILSYVIHERRDAAYHWSGLLSAAPSLFQYWRNGRPENIRRTLCANIPLYQNSLQQHRDLLGSEAAKHLHPTGWMKVFRTPEMRDRHLTALEGVRQYSVNANVLDKHDLKSLEPFLKSIAIGGIHYPDACHVRDPLALSLAYGDLFLAAGGKIAIGDANSLENSADGSWGIETNCGVARADDIVLALGPWSNDIVRKFGYRIPFFVKRGYHVHVTPLDDAVLMRPTLDTDGGFMMAPMRQGIRLTSGAEFARRDAEPTPNQIERIEPWARDLFPLGPRVNPKVWMGSRPCLPDMLPVIGRAPKHPGLWFAFGHAHHGLTLAATTGRLIADLVTGQEPSLDPAPYRIDRF